jgi:pimeloyl-ACP methyl ester carboxylesterase
VPLLIHRAWEGDFEPFVNAGVASNRGIRGILALGMLMSVVCSEDIPRIDPGMIDAVTSDTFLGDDRVRTQMAACEKWPRGDVPHKYGEPVTVDVPTLILSGTVDPVTGPDWGDEVANNLPSSVHVVLPGAHGVAGPCVQSITQAFVASGSTEGLDISCTADVRLPPFALR